MIRWHEGGAPRTARWHSENGLPPPKRVVLADDTLNADTAYRLACEGTAMLWRGDFQNARALLQAMARRIDRPPRKASAERESLPVNTRFHRYRQGQARRARLLGMLLLPFDTDYRVPLRRAPDVRDACFEAYGTPQQEGHFVASLRELLGLIGAHEWRKNGVPIEALGQRIHPHYGVFAPVRGEYIGLVAEAPFSSAASGQIPPLAFDIGTGTGVLAAVLAHRGVSRIVATDQSSRALVCADENLGRIGVADRVQVVLADLFPEGRAPLIVCNPPWLPGQPNSLLDHAIYDPDSRMLRGFLAGLAEHLAPQGEGWLVLSDIAEHLALRSRAELLAWIESGGLKVVARLEVRPTHPRSADVADLLHTARAAEITSLWRLAAR